MRLFLLLFFFCSSLYVSQNASKTNQNTLAIDHVPIVVHNLDQIKQALSNNLGFTIKEGKVHEGIQNCFTKFKDGTYLEFTKPVDSTASTGQYYSSFLNNRQGGATFAVSVQQIITVKTKLSSLSIPFEPDSNAIWSTVSPKGMDCFFIEYANKTWLDRPQFTTHQNTALALEAVYVLSNHLESDLKKYQSLGFQSKTVNYLGIPCKQIITGKNSLYLLEAAKAKKIQSQFDDKNLTGICGVKIKVESLVAFNQRLKMNGKIIVTATSTTYYLKDYNIFFIFSE